MIEDNICLLKEKHINNLAQKDQELKNLIFQLNNLKNEIKHLKESYEILLNERSSLIKGKNIKYFKNNSTLSIIFFRFKR